MRTWALGALAALAGSTGWLSGRLLLDPPSAGESRPVPSTASVARSDTELVVVYIGSSRCAASRRAEVIEAVRVAVRVLRRTADSAGVRFRAVGVAKEIRARAGIDHLASVGAFDEVAAGGSWHNLTAHRYVWGEIPGVAATPQVIVTLRKLVSPSKQDPGVGYAISSERLLARHVGVLEIADWVGRGAKIPPVWEHLD